MEIERKYLISEIPFELSQYPKRHIEQGYLCTEPVVRIRQDNDKYELTYKSGGMMARMEYNLPLNEKSYHHLLEKADGNIITKTRYLIPINDGSLTAELDIFEGKFAGMLLVEVEFNSVEQADAFQKPEWFGEDVTHNKIYHNSYLSIV